MNILRQRSAAIWIAVIGLLAACAQTPGVTPSAPQAAPVGAENAEEAWLGRSSSTPRGWPEPTPIGKVRLQSYPAYRAAVVEGDDLVRSDSMFMRLFGHIQRNDIAMTAPVEMTYGASDAQGDPTMNAMAFLYSAPEIGPLGPDASDAAVQVRDVPAQDVVSIGVRGDYDERAFDEALGRISAWLDENGATWAVDGPARYLGYDGPSVPRHLRYGEVQVPVRRSDAP